MRGRPLDLVANQCRALDIAAHLAAAEVGDTLEAARRVDEHRRDGQVRREAVVVFREHHLEAVALHLDTAYSIPINNIYTCKSTRQALHTKQQATRNAQSVTSNEHAANGDARTHSILVFATLQRCKRALYYIQKSPTNLDGRPEICHSARAA